MDGNLFQVERHKASDEWHRVGRTCLAGTVAAGPAPGAAAALTAPQRLDSQIRVHERGRARTVGVDPAVGVAPQCPHGRAARAAGAGHGAGTGVHGGPSTSEGRCRLGCGPCRPAAGCRQVNRFRLTRPLETTCRGACNGHGPARPQRHDVMRNPWPASPAETRPRRCHGTLFSRCCAGTAGARQGC